MVDATPKIIDAWELAKQYNVQDLRERVIKEVRSSPSCWRPAIEVLVIYIAYGCIGARTSGYRR